MVDALDLGSSGKPCGFESHVPYHSLADELIKAPLYNEAFGELTNISGNKSDPSYGSVAQR